jgi:uncharacterized membrane protein (UPF0182 family)
VSELFEEEPAAGRPQPAPRRSRALIITAVVLVLGFFALTTSASFFTDRMWYESVGYSSVFSTLFWTKAGLFLVFAALMALVVGLNMYLAYRMRPIFRPQSAEQSGLDRYREVVDPVRVWLLVGVSVLLGLFAGTSASGQWRSYLLWRNGGDFGSEDAQFGKDIGFYVFDLPWLHYLVDVGMAFTVVAVLMAGLVHYLYGGVRLQTSHDRLSGAAQVQLSVLAGLFVLAKAADYYLDRFDLVHQSGRLITGITYTDDHAVLPAKTILMLIAIICAVLFFANVLRRTWVLPSVGLALLALSAILLGMIWPGIVQQFQVDPTEADKEAPYIGANIEATRAAYQLDNFEVQDYSSNPNVSDAQLSALTAQTASAPLVDPKLVRETFEQLQQVRSYYSVADVLDVDRYQIQGQDRAMVLGVRELDQSGISEGDRNWSNLHTVYTHGNGVIAAFANQRGPDNSTEQEEIQFAEGQQVDEDQLQRLFPDGYESRVYFGEDSPDYSIVGKTEGANDVELDLGAAGGNTEDTNLTTYDGAGGVPVNSLLDQVLYAVKFGDPNFVLSERVNDNSKVLYIRKPADRVEKVAPWLTLDQDPYPAVVDGRIEWILDGYTVTDQYPLAQRESFEDMTTDSLATGNQFGTLPTDEINYMRNAVKATVDAYDGTVTLYAWDESDPILQAWRSAFPGTVKDKSEIPDDLMEHLRYPEDQFKVQRYQFARYHVTDPSDWYSGTNRWAVPEDPYSASNLQPPYRLFVNKADDSGQTWGMSTVFVPNGKGNLAAYMAVGSDATDEESYGKVKVLQLPPDQTQTQGPGQVASDMATDTEVRDLLQPFSLGESKPLFGNVLTMPVSDGLLYLQPVYATRSNSTSSFPELQYVIVSYGGQVGIGTTLTGALADALGVSPDDQQAPPDGNGNGDGNDNGQPTGSIDEQIRSLLDQAQEAFDAADAAQANGDTVEWAQKLDEGRALVEQAIELADSRATGSGDSSSRQN